MSDHGEGVEPGGAALSLPDHFKAMFDHSPDAIFVESLDGKIMEVNSAACRLHGRTRDELIGVSWIELVPPEHRDAAERDQENLVNSMGVIGGYSLGSDGQSIPVEIRATRIEFEGEPAMLVHVRDTVERDRAVEALHESEQRQSLLLRSLPMALYTARVGDDFAAQWVSDQIMRITGFSPQQFANEPDFWAAGLHADDQERVSAAFDEFIASNAESMSIEYRWQCADGQYRWFLDQPVLIRDQRSEPKEILGTWLDITDRKQSELACIRCRRRSPDAIFVEDLEGNVLDANPAACKLHGLTRQQLVGTNVLDLVPPEMREQVRRDFPKLAEGDCCEYEGTSWTHDGRAVPVELRVSRIEFDGRPALLLHVRDVTERNEAEQRLRETEEQTKLITDSIPALIAYIDTDHHYRYVNAAYARYFGRVADDLIDCHVRDVVGDAVYEKIGPQLNLALAGDRISFDVEAPLPGEESHFLHADYVPHKNEQGAISGVYALIDDITERVQAERRLRESEEHTRRMADMLPMTISYIDTDMRYVFNNAMHEQWFGPQVIGQQVCDVVGEEIFRIVKPHLEKALRGEQVNVDVKGKDDDGNPRHVSIIYAPHFDESGNVQGVYGVATNIT